MSDDAKKRGVGRPRVEKKPKGIRKAGRPKGTTDRQRILVLQAKINKTLERGVYSGQVTAREVQQVGMETHYRLFLRLQKILHDIPRPLEERQEIQKEALGYLDRATEIARDVRRYEEAPFAARKAGPAISEFDPAALSDDDLRIALARFESYSDGTGQTAGGAGTADSLHNIHIPKL